MKVTFSKSNLVESNARNTIVSIMADAKHGGFMRIHGFKAKTGYGEVQDTTYCKGISYPTAVERSLAMLATIEADKQFSVTVKRGVWTDNEGNINPTGRESKKFPNPKTVTETYSRGNPVMEEAIEKVKKSLTAPEQPTTEYNKLGNGVYESEDGTLYIRDLRVVSKTVVVKGDYPFKATSAVVAVADEIKKNMPVSKYRMFRMDGEFDSITIGGIEVAPEASIVESEKEAVTEEVKEQV